MCCFLVLEDNFCSIRGESEKRYHGSALMDTNSIFVIFDESMYKDVTDQGRHSGGLYSAKMIIARSKKLSIITDERGNFFEKGSLNLKESGRLTPRRAENMWKKTKVATRGDKNLRKASSWYEPDRTEEHHPSKIWILWGDRRLKGWHFSLHCLLASADKLQIFSFTKGSIHTDPLFSLLSFLKAFYAPLQTRHCKKYLCAYALCACLSVHYIHSRFIFICIDFDGDINTQLCLKRWDAFYSNFLLKEKQIFFRNFARLINTATDSLLMFYCLLPIYNTAYRLVWWTLWVTRQLVRDTLLFALSLAMHLQTYTNSFKEKKLSRCHSFLQVNDEERQNSSVTEKVYFNKKKFCLETTVIAIHYCILTGYHPQYHTSENTNIPWNAYHYKSHNIAGVSNNTWKICKYCPKWRSINAVLRVNTLLDSSHSIERLRSKMMLAFSVAETRSNFA